MVCSSSVYTLAHSVVHVYMVIFFHSYLSKVCSLLYLVPAHHFEDEFRENKRISPSLVSDARIRVFISQGSSTNIWRIENALFQANGHKIRDLAIAALSIYHEKQIDGNFRTPTYT